MQCTITFEVSHIKLYALVKAAWAWPVVPHIPQVLDTGVKFLFGPLFCSLLADLNCVNSTPVNFGRGNSSKGFKLKKKVCWNYFFCGYGLENVGNTKYGKLKIVVTGKKTVVRDLIIVVNVQHGTTTSSHFMRMYQRHCRKWKRKYF